MVTTHARRTASRCQRGHYYRLYTQQFRHELEVAYGVAEGDETNEREGISADSVMVKREAVAAD